MDGQTSGTTETMDNQAQIDPWIAAFAALEQKDEEDPTATADMGNADDGGTAADTEGTGGQELPDKDETIDSVETEGNAGGFGVDVGGAEPQDSVFAESYGLDETGIEQLQQEFDKQISDRVINDIAQEFIKRGYKHTNGVLGITINDPSVRRNDKDGVPHFYNIYTGEEIYGERPREKCQELVDDYNSSLSAAFNEACSQYEAYLRKQEEPQLAVKKFAPKYEKLDPIRRGMLDNAIEDYEIKDKDGKVVGYSCDLDKQLALVDKQIAMIQSYAKQHQPQQQRQSTGPVLDMKTSSGAVPNNDAPVTSLAEAMERLQDAELAKLKR